MDILPRAATLARTRRRLGALDGWLLRRALGSRTPTSDLVLRAASQAANRSKLWLAISAALGLAGGSRGRRAATRGLLAIGISSAVVNGPLKYVWRRQRPAVDLLGIGPSLIAMPRSFSFPSGHSASAFAFATGVAREWPAVGAPVGGPQRRPCGHGRRHSGWCSGRTIDAR
jgi:membrane-associated phospholipid phosphatase